MLCIEEYIMIRVHPCLVVLNAYCGAAWQPSRRLIDLLHVGISHLLMDIHFTTLLKHGRTYGSTVCMLVCSPLPACLCANEMYEWTGNLSRNPTLWRVKAYVMQRRTPGYSTMKRRDRPNLP